MIQGVQEIRATSLGGYRVEDEVVRLLEQIWAEQQSELLRESDSLDIFEELLAQLVDRGVERAVNLQQQVLKK